jgi:hypothetical protein
MSTLTKRATVYLDPALHKALRLQIVCVVKVRHRKDAYR